MISVRRILVACALFTLLAAGSAAPEDAATVVPGGALDKDAAWSGTVLVERETRVGRGATLAVKPGTVVLFRKGAGLVVEGELVAEGDAGAPIRFASAEKEAAPGDWTGISFIGARDGSVLSRCSVLDAAAINVEGCSPAIRRCEIGRGRTGIIVARKAAPSISGNLVRGMADGGIRCERESAPRIEANEITECGPFGILAGQDAAPAVRKNRVTGCERGLAFSGTIPPVEGNEWRNNKVGVVAGSAGTSQAIRGNRFTGNRTGLLCEQFSNLLVEGNEFRENGDAIVCFRSSSPVIRNNAIAKNEQGILGTQLSNPKIEANEISGNRKGIFLTLSSYAVVHGNNIHGNDVQMELGNMSHDWEVRVGKKPERGAQARLSVRMSRGLAGPREIAESQKWGDGAEVMRFVDATGNWWGEEDTKEMEAKGPDANIGRLVDYHDVPTRTYEGYEGVYVQDKIRYEGWKKERIAGAGINAVGGGIIKGKINFQGKPLEGAVVSLYSSHAGGFRGAPDYRSAPTGKDGAFSVAAEKGQYFLLARKTLAGDGAELRPGDHYAYYGGNPVVLGEGETIAIGINCGPILDVGERYRPGGTGIRGNVSADGKPLERARVTLYQDGETIFRGIGYASVLTGKGGDFTFNLEPGTYYVVARKRAEGDRMGPLEGGDFFGFAHDNPVEVRKDSYTVISINAVTKLVKVKEGGQEVTLGGTVKSGETVIEGVIRDRAGSPVAGVYASAYRDSMMTQKPDFISKRTGPDGAYAIPVSQGGEYFIGARNTIGGPAERGDLLGKYDGSDDHSVRIRTGEKLKGIDIVVEKVE